jgi:hypothetical protein
MSLNGVSHDMAIPAKVARELKDRIAELFTRYSFEEVMKEIAKQKPKYDITIATAGKVKA